MEQTQTKGVELSGYEPLLASEQVMYDSVPSSPKAPVKSHKRLYFFGAGGLAVVCVTLVAVFAFLPSNDSHTDEDRTTDLYQSLQGQAQKDGLVTIDSSTDQDIADLLKSIIETDSITLDHAKVSLARDDKDKHAADGQEDLLHVDVKGHFTLYDKEHFAHARLHYLNGRAHLWAVVQPVSSENAVAVKLGEWVKEKDMHQNLKDLTVASPNLIVSSIATTYKGHKLGRGLNVFADTPFSLNPDRFQAFKKLGFSSARLAGLLKPHCWCPDVSVTDPIPIIKNVIWLTNVTETVTPDQSQFIVSAYLHIQPGKKAEEIQFFLEGVDYLQQSILNLNGSQVGEWNIPGVPDSFALDKFFGQLTINYQNQQAAVFSGAVSAGFEWGKASGLLRADIPPKGWPTGVKNFALEGRLKAPFKFTDIPEVSALPDGAPPKALAFTGTAVVIYSSADGWYTFQDTEAPAPMVYVVGEGVNLVVKIDWAHSSSPEMQAFGSAIDLKDAVLVAGGMASKEKVRLYANVTDVAFPEAKVKVHTANVSFGTDSPYFRFGALFEVDKDFVGTGEPLTAFVEGKVTDQQVQADGNVSNIVKFTVGDTVKGTLDRMWYNFTWSYKSHEHTDDVRALVNINDVEYKGDFLYPAMNVGDYQCKRWELERFAATTVQDALQSLGIDKDEIMSLPVSTDVLQAFLDTEFDNVDFIFSPVCENLTFAAYVKGGDGVFGEGSTVGISLMKGCPVGEYCKPWWSIFLVPTKDWDFSSSGLIDPTLHFPHVALKDLLFVVSSADTVLTLPDLVAQKANLQPTQFKDLTVIQGVQFKGVLIIDSSSEFDLIRKLDPSATELDVHGEFTPKDFNLYVTLGNLNLPKSMGHGVFLTAFDIVLFADWSVTPKIAGTKVHAQMLIPLDGKNVTFDTWGDVELDHVTLASKASPPGVSWKLNDLPFTLDNLNCTVDLSWAGGVFELKTGAIGGEILMDNQCTLDAQVALWVGPSGAGVELTASISENPPLTIGALLDQINEALMTNLHLPAQLEEQLNMLVHYESGWLVASTQPLSINVTGVAVLMGQAAVQIVLNVWKDSTGKWQATIAANLGPLATPKDVFGTSALNASSFPCGDLRVAFSTCDNTIQFPADVPQPSKYALRVGADPPPVGKTYQIYQGFNFLGVLYLTGTTSKALTFIHDYLKVDTLELWGIVAALDSFELHADITSHMTLLDFLTLDAGGVFVKVQQEDAQFGLELDTSVHITAGGDDTTLKFHDDGFIGELGFGFDASMTTPWPNPLGIPGLTLDQCALALELSWDIVPVHIGVAGGAHIGETGADVAVWIDVDGGEMANIKIDEVHLQQLVDSILSGLGLPKAPTMVDTLTDMGFDHVDVYANTMTAPLRFNGKTYNPGFMADLTGLDLWEIIKGDAHLEATTSRLLLNATLQPINLLDGKLVISGAEGPDTNALLSFILSGSAVAAAPKKRERVAIPLAKTAVVSTLPVQLDISGGVQAFGQWLRCALEIDDSHFNVFLNMSVIENMFDLVVQAGAAGTTFPPTDFNLDFELNNKIQDWIATEVPKLVDGAKTEIDKDLDEVKADLEAKQNDVDDLNKQIADEEAKWNHTVSDVIKELNKWTLEVEEDKQHVDSLQSNIDSLEQKIHDLKWYEKWKAVGYGAEIAALEIAKTTADGVLSLAEDALEKAKEAAQGALPDLDPKLIELRTEKGVKMALLKVAEAAVDAVEDAVNHLGTLVDDIAKWQGEIFNIEELKVSGSMAKMLQGDLVSLHVKGKFVGHDVEFDSDIDLADLKSVVGSIWHGILKLFHADHLGDAPVPWVK